MDASAQVTFSFLSSFLFSLGSWCDSADTARKRVFLLTHRCLWKHPYWHAQTCDASVILEPVKLIGQINHQSFFLEMDFFLRKASFLLYRGHYQWVPSSPVAHTGSNCCGNLYLIGPCNSASQDFNAHRSIREFMLSNGRDTYSEKSFRKHPLLM